MAPAYERLCARNDTTAEAHDRLVLKPKLAAVDATLKISYEVFVFGPL
jgi:hypothetical protein